MNHSIIIKIVNTIFTRILKCGKPTFKNTQIDKLKTSSQKTANNCFKFMYRFFFSATESRELCRYIQS